jgi:hypothetical protein
MMKFGGGDLHNWMRSPHVHVPAPETFNGFSYSPVRPQHRIYLKANGEGDELRFAQRLGIVADRLPRADLRMLANYWQNHASNSLIPPWSPQFILADDWVLENGIRDVGDYEYCGRGGHLMYFWAPALDRMPEALVDQTIGLVLAFALDFAIQGPRTEQSPSKGQEWITVRRWGLSKDKYLLKRWQKEHYQELVQLERDWLARRRS